MTRPLFQIVERNARHYLVTAPALSHLADALGVETAIVIEPGDGTDDDPGARR